MDEETMSALSVQDLCRRWGMSQNHVEQRCREGSLPAFRLAGGTKWRIPLAAVLALEADVPVEAIKAAMAAGPASADQVAEAGRIITGYKAAEAARIVADASADANTAA